MAVRDDFTAGEVLAAADLNDTFASKPPFAYGTATPSTTVEGFIWYDENDTPPAPKFWDGSAFETFGGGKLLQIVRATDTTSRSTTSTSFVDVTGMSVTITPQTLTCRIIIIASGTCRTEWTTESVDQSGHMQMTTSGNVALSGAETSRFGLVRGTTNASGVFWFSPFQLFGYIEPASVSAQTYKMRFKSGSASTGAVISNDQTTGQMYAIEVSA